MPNAPWKEFERLCGGLVSGKRYPANVGSEIDVEGPKFCGQCKNVKRGSLAWLEGLLLTIQEAAKKKDKTGIVFVKRRAGRGVTTPTLVIMDSDTFKELTSGNEESD